MSYNKDMAVFESDGAGATLDFAEKYAETLEKGDIILLDGELGAGKTVFAKGIAKGLGIEDEVVSPTYAYMNEYGGGVLYHLDCYRLTSGEQALFLGLCDCFYTGGICVIEWPDNIASVLPGHCRRVTIKKTGETSREIDYE